MLLLQTFCNNSSEKNKNCNRIEECIMDLKSGSLRSLNELYTLTKASVFAFALSVLKNRHDAEDVTQDCYVNIVKNASTYRPEGKPLAWMLTITKNLCLIKLRENKRTELFLPEENEDLFSIWEDSSVEDRLILSACINILSDEERQIVVLYAVAGFKHKEIAKLLNFPLSTVLSKYSRALKKLKNYLEEQGNYEK